MVALVNVGERFLASFDKALRHHRLSRAGREALAVLEGAAGPLSPTTIAERLIVTTASVTSLLDTLERRGLVERRPDPTDRRKLLVVITDAGVELVDQFLPELVALQTAAFVDAVRGATTTARRPAVARGRRSGRAGRRRRGEYGPSRGVPRHG